MSTYHYIGCEKCREQTAFMRDGMAGFGWMGRAQEEVPQFVEKHSRNGHAADLRIYDEHDPRSDDFDEFDPEKPWDVEP